MASPTVTRFYASTRAAFTPPAPAPLHPPLTAAQCVAGTERTYSHLLLAMTTVLALALGLVLHGRPAPRPPLTAQHTQQARIAAGLETITPR